MFIVPQTQSIQEAASACGAELHLNGASASLELSGAGPIESAQNGDLSFIENPKYLKFLKDTSASAVLCLDKFRDQVPVGVAAIVHSKPYEAYAQILALLYPTAMRPLPVTGIPGISDQASIHPDANIEEDVMIEAGAVVGPNASIGSGTVLLPGSVIGQEVQIGRNCAIGANATIVHALLGDNVIIHNGVQIGQDGFGFAMGPGGHKKIPQIGRVIIQDHVEIGANSTVDRGANRDTVIGEGTKIDNLVQIGHNATIGRNCVIVGLAGISGSATLGDFVVVAGQAGIVGHTTIGHGAQVGGGSGVHGDVAPGERVMGYPAIKASTWMRQAAKIMLADKKDRKKGKGNND
ncbi:MAG: UDP-3-O-(3-hydroxymyristoyl)glucosamine N-acyltransferase [Rhizobiaceae bacterium]|nr:UDP-3-O-(3-hydroxymyristoyl)glucosamine N-acyltransferase [Rhizobiaceae bacterium]